MLAQNLAQIKDRMARACEASARDADEVTLIAVSKTFAIDDIRRAYDLGLRDFGESRLQEAQPKIESLPGDIRWHFVGKLQSNKVKKIATLFDVIHTIDAETQLKEIVKSARSVPCLIEVNIAEEPQKGGISTNCLDEFKKIVLNYPHAHLRGLMTIGPALADPEGMRPYFRALKGLATEAGLEWLSMGMSGDFEVAIQEGSTHIRVGTALFGSR